MAMLDAQAVGRSFAPITAHVEPGRLRQFRKAIGAPVTDDSAPIPPTYLFCLEMLDADDPFAALGALGIDLSRVLHGEQGFRYFAPVLVGDSLIFQSSVTSVVDKKGGAMTLVGIATRVTNQHDVHVADLTRTVVVNNPVQP